MIPTYTTQPHYQHHINHTTPNTTPTNPHTTKPTTQPIITASRPDADTLDSAGWSNIVLIEHGVGQSYRHHDGVRVDASNNRDVNGSVRWWLGPNRLGWDAVADRFPNAEPVFVSSHLWGLARRPVDADMVDLSVPTIGVAVHWSNPGVKESRGGWPASGEIVGRLKRRRPDWRVVVMPHPKLNVGGVRRHPMVRPHPDVIVDSDWPVWVPHVDVLVADNTSVMWEAAALGIPVIGFRPPHWREWDVMPEHGLRFPGPNHVPIPADHSAIRDVVTDTIRFAESDDPDFRGFQQSVLDTLYPTFDDTPAIIAEFFGSIIE